jgi:bacillithiol synthase
MSIAGLRFQPLTLGTNKLAADYLAGLEPATSFLGGCHDDQSRLKELAATVDKRLDRNRAAEVLAGQRSFPLIENGRNLLDSFVEYKGFCVVTGQQPVLFGGPLYVLYKCISVLQAAREYESLLGRPVLPVFWTASEDHDLAEASSVAMPGLDNEPETLGLPVANGNYRPLCQIALGDKLGEVRELLEKITPDTEFRPELFSILDEAYTERCDFGHAFSEFIVRLFASRGLFVVDACSPELRKGATRLMEQEIFDSSSSAGLFEETSVRIDQAGYRVQVRSQENDTGLFVLSDGRRVKLQRDSDQYSLKGVGDKLSGEELRQMLQTTPEVFSPGVRVRPLVEAELFGTLCYLAGPGEIAYYAQLRPLYGLRGLQMPVIRPRLSGVLLEARIEKVLDKYGITAETLEQGVEHTAQEFLQGDKQWLALTAELESLRTAMEQGFARVGDHLAGIDPTMSGPLAKTRSTVNVNLDKLRGKFSQAVRRRDETMLSQLGKAGNHLWPRGGRQERETSWLYYLVRYGEPMIDWFLEQV